MAGTMTAVRPRPRLGAATRTDWFWYGVVSMVATAVLVPVLPDESEVLAGVTSTAAMFVGLRRYRPRLRRAWVYLAIAQVFLVVSLAGWLTYLYSTGEEAPVPTIMDAVCLCYYPFFAAGLASFTRRQVGRSPWEGVLDAVLVALGVAAVLWTLVVDPYRQASGMPPLTLLTGLSYPAGDLLLIVMLAWLLFTTSVRTPAMTLLTAGCGVTLVADCLNAVLIARGWGMAGDTLTYIGWDISYVLIGMAALHPSMTREVEPRHDSKHVISRFRVGLYLVLSMAGPLVMVVALTTGISPQDGKMEDVLFSLLVSVAVSVLLVVRLTQIARLANDRAAALNQQAAELERAQLAQLLAHRRVSAMFRAAPTGMALLDPDGLVLAANPALARFLARPADRLEGTSLGTFVNAQDLPGILAALRAAAAGADTQHGEFRGQKATGATLWADYAVSSARGADDEHTAIMVIADRTAYRQLEIERRHAQKLEAIGRLAASVAHELDTPIQFIGDNINFLGESATTLLSVAMSGNTKDVESDVDYLTEEIPEAVRQTKEGVQRVATIVTALKSFAHRDAPGHHPADVNRALSDSITVARGELRNVAYTRVALGNLPLVPCSIGDLNQAFLNLLVNAADAAAETQTPESPGRVTIRSWAEELHVVIEIADTGPGIPDELAEKVFEPFFTTKPVGQGTGQGLALARSIVVDGHGGSIDFTSTPGEGTTFTVCLPITPADDVSP
jgi:PAS domain S-box-containing protein